MSLDSLNPAVLVVIAGLLALFAGYVSQTRQAKNTAAMREQLDVNTKLMREMAAQTGDQKMLQEVIDLRTKLLETGRGPSDAEIKKILAQVPHLTDEYRKLQHNEQDAAGKLLADFRANWEPLIRVVVSEFDRRVGAVVASGVKLSIKKDDSFKVAGVGQDGGNGQLIRTVELNGAELRLYVSSAQVHPNRIEGGYVAITVRIPEKSENESNPLDINFQKDEAAADGKTFPALKSGAPNGELVDIALAGINKGIEHFLVVANARKK